MYLSDFELERLLAEDCEYGDITTPLVGFAGRAKCAFVARSEICATSVDLAARICAKFGLEWQSEYKNGDIIAPSGVIGTASGDFGALHTIYKAVQILFEHSTRISTIAHVMVTAAQKVNPKCQVLATRKTFPFAKKLCLRAAVHGGAKIHRIGVFDEILFFKSHLCAFGSLGEFCARVGEMKAQMPEKKLSVECESADDAHTLFAAGVDILQCDKLGHETLREIVAMRDSEFAGAIVLAAGGINEKNAGEFAATGIDGIVTSRMFAGGMSDIGAKFELI